MVKDILHNHQSDLAFIVGNGINRFANISNALSWDDLLLQLWKKFSGSNRTAMPEGVSVTEIYDLLDLEMSSDLSARYTIQKEVSAMMHNWQFQTHHQRFMEKAKAWNVPVLTTNFDLILPQALQLTQFFTNKKNFSDFYPWDTYYGVQQWQQPADGFGLWYINGCIQYPRSIRLGLSHYMGAVERARNLIHKGKSGNLYGSRQPHTWSGSHTWLQIIFQRSLFIVGLGLEENEVFLRWLLIERAKYYRKYPSRKKPGWYITRKPTNRTDRHNGKKYFLEKLGLQVVEVDDYGEMYL